MQSVLHNQLRFSRVTRGRATISESMSTLAVLRQPLSIDVWVMVSLCSQSGLF